MKLPSIRIAVNQDIFESRLEHFVRIFEKKNSCEVNADRSTEKLVHHYQIGLCSQDSQASTGRSIGEIKTSPLDDHRTEMRSAVFISEQDDLPRLFFDQLFRIIRETYNIIWDKSHSGYAVMRSTDFWDSPVAASIIGLSFKDNLVLVSGPFLTYPLSPSKKEKKDREKLREEREHEYQKLLHMHSSIDNTGKPNHEKRDTNKNPVDYGLNDYLITHDEEWESIPSTGSTTLEIRKPTRPRKPPEESSREDWFDYYYKSNEAGYKVTHKDIAKELNLVVGTVRQLYSTWKKNRGIS